MIRKAGMVIALLGALASIAYSQVSLKDAYKNDFVIGAALNRQQIEGADKLGVSIIKEQFSTISPENALKWASLHPKPDTYDFSLADKYVEFGEKNHMFIVGHTLVWHGQTPRWVFQDDKGNPVDRDTLLKRMEEHITTVVGRYKGRIHGWDVVNEVIDEDGSLRKSQWLKIIGEDFIEKAFEFAHKADPKAELYYNDYSIENEKKRAGALELVKKLIAKGVPITGVGCQGHISLTFPTLEQEESMITDFGKLGLKVHITELDIDVLPEAVQGNSAEISQRAENSAKLDPYKEGLPKAVEEQQAKRYADLFALWKKHHDVVKRITLWGVTDGDSWKNNFPVRGRTNYPLLFDRSGKPKAAVAAIVNVAQPAGAAAK